MRGNLGQMQKQLSKPESTVQKAGEECGAVSSFPQPGPAGYKCGVKGEAGSPVSELLHPPMACHAFPLPPTNAVNLPAHHPPAAALHHPRPNITLHPRIAHSAQQQPMPLLPAGGDGGSGPIFLFPAGGGGDGDGDKPGRSSGWRWSWSLSWAALAMAAGAGKATAIVLDSSTRQTYVGEFAVKYAEAVRQACEQYGYEFYDAPYQLNIVGVRNPSDDPGAFDDHFAVVYSTGEEGGKPSGWVVTSYTASVDPGRAWLTMGWGGPGGTAILCPGQYVDAYEVGLHNGKYEALVQERPVKVWRDYDRDGKLDFGEHGSFDDEGLFGVNIHHAGIKDTAEYKFLLTKYTDMVEKYSAGCQVIATVEDFGHFMETVKLSVRKGHKPYFTYTLFQGEETWDTISGPLQQARETLQPYLT